MQLVHEIHHLLAVCRVEVPGGLVREQDQRVAHDGARYRNALLLAARELTRHVLGAVGHLHTLERRLHLLPALTRWDALVRERQLDVVVDAEIADQVEALEDEADLLAPHARSLRGGQIPDRPLVEGVRTPRGRVQQAEDREQGGLPAAGGSGDRHVLPGMDLEIHVREGVRLDLVRLEYFRDGGELNQRLRVLVHLRLLPVNSARSGPPHPTRTCPRG